MVKLAVILSDCMPGFHPAFLSKGNRFSLVESHVKSEFPTHHVLVCTLKMFINRSSVILSSDKLLKGQLFERRQTSKDQLKVHTL